MDYLEAHPASKDTVARRVESVVFPIFKRSLDIVVSLMLLPALIVVAAILLVLNLLTNPVPLIYTQSRVGQGGKVFRIVKFCTMMGEQRETCFAVEETDRIHRLGGFLRRSRIDELPQILNVLKGDMSLIGPRPEQVPFYELYDRTIPNYARRQDVRPGISGLAQLKCGYTSDHIGAQKKLRWDLEYINRKGFRLEMYIFWQTLVFLTLRTMNLRTKSPL
jgi:lipopolysaccharide/colanic/teichoic acid biosynthesis glycosyltransferase